MVRRSMFEVISSRSTSPPEAPGGGSRAWELDPFQARCFALAEPGAPLGELAIGDCVGDLALVDIADEGASGLGMDPKLPDDVVGGPATHDDPSLVDPQIMVPVTAAALVPVRVRATLPPRLEVVRVEVAATHAARGDAPEAIAHDDRMPAVRRPGDRIVDRADEVHEDELEVDPGWLERILGVPAGVVEGALGEGERVLG